MQKVGLRFLFFFLSVFLSFFFFLIMSLTTVRIPDTEKCQRFLSTDRLYQKQKGM